MLSLKSAKQKRMLIVLLALGLLSVSFWSSSRYPTLNEKAIMGGDALTEDPLTFMAVIEQQDGDPFWKRVGISSINWAAENRQGMTFGIMIGAGFLTLFGLFQRRGTNNAFLNTLLGIGMGAPLGVCVNCAAPIAKGMHDSGARIETTLSAMFASPTLNVIIITMLLSIFPFYLVAIKLGLTLVFLLIGIPLLSRTVFKEEAEPTYDDESCPIPPPPIRIDESWFEALKGTAFEYVKNLWYIIKTTLPLMVLAGALAAVAVQLLPLERLGDMPIGFLSVTAAALIGIFLPVPIGLDVVISATLLAAGVPVMLVGILLFTLGIYSVYSFSIIWTTISKRAAIVLTVVLIGFGIVAGGMAEIQYQRDMQAMEEELDSLS